MIWLLTASRFPSPDPNPRAGCPSLRESGRLPNDPLMSIVLKALSLVQDPTCMTAENLNLLSWDRSESLPISGSQFPKPLEIPLARP
jgi:hypothetical protein